MSKRLLRISSKDIFASLESLLRTEINVVLDDGNTHFGKLASYTQEQLLLHDTRNHPHTISLPSVYEIVYDAAQR